MQQSRRHAAIAASEDQPLVRGSSNILIGVAVVVAIGVYSYVINSINLPEEIEVYIAVGVAFGLLVGRWPIVIAGLAAFSIAIDPEGRSDEAWTYIWFVYLPAAALSIAAGVLVRQLTLKALQWKAR